MCYICGTISCSQVLLRSADALSVSCIQIKFLIAAYKNFHGHPVNRLDLNGDKVVPNVVEWVLFVHAKAENKCDEYL